MILDTFTAQHLHLRRLHCKQIQTHIFESIEKVCLLNKEHRKEMLSFTESGASKLEIATLLFTQVSNLMENHLTRNHQRACIRIRHELEIQALEKLHRQNGYAMAIRTKALITKGGTLEFTNYALSFNIKAKSHWI